MKIKLLALQDIKPYYNNPRDNSSAVPVVVESFKRYGFIKPIICDKDNVIIAGHTRYVAAFQLGLTQVPVVISEMDEEKAKRFRIADNKLAEKSEFDETSLIEELKGLQVPENLQSFFFEDISNMINFSYSDIHVEGVENCYNDDDDNDDNNDDDDFMNESNSGSDNDDASNKEGIGNEREDCIDNSDFDDLYKVKLIDGHKMMKVICPYCGSIEIIKIDE